MDKAPNAFMKVMRVVSHRNLTSSGDTMLGVVVTAARKWRLITIGSLALTLCVTSCTALTRFFDTESYGAGQSQESQTMKRVPIPPTVRDFEPQS
ncbi:MAG: hypothetical protein WCG29_04195 [Desulfomonile sp.]